MNQFSDRIRQRRSVLGLTQEALGIRVGVTKATVSGWENGRSYPEFSLLEKLRIALELTHGGVGHLICGDSTEALAVDGIRQVMDVGPEYKVDPSRAGDSKELAVLLRFRTLSAAKRSALLELLKPGE